MLGQEGSHIRGKVGSGELRSGRNNKKNEPHRFSL